MQIGPRQIETIDDRMVEVLRRKTGADRLKIANDLFVMARRMLLIHLREKHPDWNERQVLREAARRLSHGSV